MRTQSKDTSPKAEQVQIALLRLLPITKKFAIVRSTTAAHGQRKIQLIQKQHPDASIAEVLRIFVASQQYWKQPELIPSVEALLPKDSPMGWKHTTSDENGRFSGETFTYRVISPDMKPSFLEENNGRLHKVDILSALHSLVLLLERHHIAYYLGGSVATSVYGMQQFAQDLDVVIDIQAAQIASVLRDLRVDYYLDEHALYQAVQHEISTISMLHLNTLVKVDLIVPAVNSFEKQAMARAQQHILDEAYQPFKLSSPEDIILAKLLCHRGESLFPDDQWNDIIGVLKIQAEHLDLSYLDRWAVDLAISSLFEQACNDAGIRK